MFDQLIITVTRDHIERGIPKDCVACPIALAVNEIEPDYMEVISIGSPGITISTYGDGIKTFAIPQEADEFLVKFDRGDKVEPFTFATVV